MMCDCDDIREDWTEYDTYWIVTRICNKCGRVIDFTRVEK